MTSELIIEYPSVELAAKLLDSINKFRNAEVTKSSVNEITKSTRNLIRYCNANFLEVAHDIVYKPCNKFPAEIQSWYYPNLNLTNIPEFIISTFEELEKDPYRIDTGNRCVDALCVLVDCMSAVVLWRIDRTLEVRGKKMDELHSSNSVETSIHLENGDGYG
jgi:hypothetical protein